MRIPVALLLSGTLILATLTGCKKKPPADVAAAVNGRPITNAELDKVLQSQFGAEMAKRPANDDQVRSLRLQTLMSLIDKEIMFQRAEKQSLIAADSEVDAEIAKLRAGYTQEEFQRQLAARNLSLDDLRTQMRRDLSVQKLINKEITSKIQITDKDISDFYAANKQTFNLAEPQLHLAEIVVTPTPDQKPTNLRGNKAQNDEQAKKKIGMIEMRLRQGEDFAVLAQNFSENPQSAPNGGDLGFFPESALDRVHPELKKMVMSLQPGQISRVISTGDSYRILRLVSREPAGQRELTDPSVQQNIREALMGRRDQLLKEAYTEVARNEAKIENYLARSIVQPASK